MEAKVMDANEHILQQMDKRVADLTRFLEQSMANHNALAGRLAEAKDTAMNFRKTLAELAKMNEPVPEGAQGNGAVTDHNVAALDQPVN